jgi:hypothetical protein
LSLKIQNPYFIRVLAYGVSFESVAQNSRPMGFSIKNGEGIVQETGFFVLSSFHNSFRIAIDNHIARVSAYFISLTEQYWPTP